MGMRYLHKDKLERLAQKALASGARVKTLGLVEWDIHGNCVAPRTVQLYSRADRESGSVNPFGPSIIMRCRCRKCETCRNLRRWGWTYRARRETARAARTWFGTLTLSPSQLQHFKTVARSECGNSPKRVAELKARGEGPFPPTVDFDSLPADEQFRVLVGVIGREITMYLKRVRKAADAPLRYMLVCEMHKGGGAHDGEPHFHLLVHQVDPDRMVTWRHLSTKWTCGFTNFKLVTEQKHVSYVCKYLAKDALARVRASARYGSEIEDLGNAVLNGSKVKRSVTDDLKKETPYLNCSGVNEYERVSQGLSDALAGKTAGDDGLSKAATALACPGE
ncbi:replication initiation protein [Tortoise microvirus 88]|nr:replication initiation protein [Tortoise microvirus 88]